MQDKIKHVDVVIVGAGMVGATIACGLAQHNLRIALIDRALPKSIKSGEPPRIRVSALHLASEQLLQNLGAWAHIPKDRALAYSYLAVKEMPAKSGFVSKLPDITSWATTRFEAQDLGREHLGHILENDAIQLGLLDRVAELPNIELVSGVTIESSELGSDKRMLTLSDGSVMSADLVVGADGAQSQMRRIAGIGQFSESYTQHAMVVSITYKGGVEQGTWQAFRPEGPLAFLPLPRIDGVNYGSLVWYDSPNTIAQLKGLSDAELRQKLQAIYPQELPDIEQILQVASFPLAKSHAQQYSGERIVLAGDAAHTINPLAGQGVNLGFMDAAVLIEELGKALINDQALSDRAVLKNYEKQRRMFNQLMMSGMDAFYYGFSNRSAPVQIIRNIGLGLAHRSGPLKQKVLEYATGLQGSIPKLAKVSDV
ncbi:hypothetical protein A3715_15110 [Oleiphilus sp. HI0009]|nr:MULTISPECIES: FAD-dependent oxidoreductase [unclassified Oleiphilus]KZX74841.1 hypothetical protein A3715_15110 [Oleiphilus sp. HI0009]KZY62688.1 hypothetical protein A3738_12600 [Oleiphilus sp. HI0066]KZY70865.1 hypothetical protein A3739_05705 [Oleiphilus sp. HI0067]MCH2158187.1 FAD-dependent oxidoreductase [Oleiphilaceae bacterium]